MVGEVIADRYELEELCGSGGMSMVYRAHDRLLERTVALKLLHDRHLDDDDSVERFRREARSAAGLSHPNIVTVIDRGEHEGRPFIVFEYVPGENLKERLRRDGALPVRDALELGAQIGRALAYAHEHGLIHRDVKPQNVILNGDDTAKVTDFGIARSLDVARGLTQTGTVLGTSDYIAPEQAQGESVDERTDVYSLGIVLFELLTGDVPFRGDSFVEVALRHVNEPAPLVSDYRADVPPRAVAAVARALQKRPRDRFPTMAAFCTELEAALAGEPSSAPTVIVPARPAPQPVAGPRRVVARRAVWPYVALAAGIVAAIAAVAGYLVAHNGGSPARVVGGRGGAAAHAAPIPVKGVTAYDPDGTGGEHNDEARLATDGNQQTYWKTESYHDTLATLHKRGVGVVLDAGSARELSRIVVQTDTPGFEAQIQASDSADGGFAADSASQTVGSSATFRLEGAKARYYLVWITQLPPGLVAHVNEVRAS